jgi:hypothetical protein
MQVLSNKESRGFIEEEFRTLAYTHITSFRATQLFGFKISNQKGPNRRGSAIPIF